MLLIAIDFDDSIHRVAVGGCSSQKDRCPRLRWNGLLSAVARKDVTDFHVVKAYSEYRERGFMFVYEYLSVMTGEPQKVCYRAMERAADHGLIEYGVSLRTGWLTDKGKQLLASCG